MSSVLERVVRWNLDLDDSGHIYGDERERFRWYEGIAMAAQLQWLAVPWAAAILVWLLGRPSVLPLSVVLAVLAVPMIMCTVYVRGRRVETDVRVWTRKRILLTVLSSVPVIAFVLGALRAFSDTHPSAFRGALIGALFGSAIGVGRAIAASRRHRRRETTATDDE
jgi:hypothetical protein